jgi:hypothetical protein
MKGGATYNILYLTGTGLFISGPTLYKLQLKLFLPKENHNARKT